MNRALFLLPLIAGIVASTPVSGQSNLYVDTLAGYSIVYPLETTLTSGLDAALGFNTVFVQFPETYEGEYAGVTISIFDNVEGKYVEQFARERFNLSRDAPGRVRGEWINGMPVLLANRPSPLTGEDAAVALIEGDGVIIRIALLGSDSNGRLEPMTTHYDWFNQIAHSIRRVPREAPQALPLQNNPDATAAPATDFRMPFDVPVVADYSELYGVAISNSAYGVRNLDLEHRRTCYGVDWPRLLHTGIDWSRADEQYQIPTDVYAVGDGVVDWYDPMYNGYPGKVVIMRHTLPDARSLYSVYAHLGPDVSIVPGQVVSKGQRIGSLLDQGDNTHLHFEMRWFLDGRNIYGPYTACNSSTLIVGRGYTYRVSPDDFPTPGNGYVDPRDYIDANNNARIPVRPMASVLTSTLPLADVEPARVIKADTNRPVLINTSYQLTETLNQTPPLSTTFILSTTDPYTSFLPLTLLNYPYDGPMCIEGQQLLSNTGFEVGPASAPWVQSSNGTVDLIQDSNPFAGTYDLWFGGRNLADEEVLQSFMLPYNTQGITLTLQRYLTTTETESKPYDILEIVVENADGIEVTPRVLLDNTAMQKNVWVPVTIVYNDMLPLFDMRLQLSIKIATDASLPTSFYIDDVQAVTHCVP